MRDPFTPATGDDPATAIPAAHLLAARQLAEAVAASHAAGVVFGALNPGRVVIGPGGEVTLRDAADTPAMPEYTAPELQNAFAAATTRTAAHDQFALAVLLFQLLMDGHHPFAGRWRGGGSLPPIPQAMQLGLYAFGEHSAAAPPPGAPDIARLDPALAGLFARSFNPTSAVMRTRPSAAEWAQALGSTTPAATPALPSLQPLLPSPVQTSQAPMPVPVSPADPVPAPALPAPAPAEPGSPAPVAANAAPLPPPHPAPARPPAGRRQPPVADATGMEGAAPVVEDISPAPDHPALSPREENPEQAGVWKDRDPLPALAMHPRGTLPTWEPGASPLEDVTSTGDARPRRRWRSGLTRRDLLVGLLVAGVVLLGRAGMLPIATRRRSPGAVPATSSNAVATVPPEPTTSAMATVPLRVPMAPRDAGSALPEGSVAFKGRDFAARLVKQVLRLSVTLPGGWGIVTFLAPPAAGNFTYSVTARPVVGRGELLVTLTDAKTRVIWVWLLDLDARTWAIAQDRLDGKGRQALTEPRSYATLGPDAGTISVSVRRREEDVRLLINGRTVGAPPDALPGARQQLEPGIGAAMGPEAPADAAQVYWVAVELVSLMGPAAP